MKITKLIIPLLGLSQINNVSNQANAIQIEKEINMPYEVLARDNWDSYLTNTNETENLIQNQIAELSQQNEIRELRPISHAGCEDGCYQTYCAACTMCSVGWINPAAYAVCMTAAGTAYAACLVLCRQYA